jgi:hypothetical protein
MAYGILTTLVLQCRFARVIVPLAGADYEVMGV